MHPGKRWPVQDTIKKSFEAPHPGYKYTKIRIPAKKNWTYTVHMLWSTRSTTALRYLGWDHFGRIRTKIYGRKEMLLGKKLQCVWLSWWHRLCTCSLHKDVFLRCWPRVRIEGFNEEFPRKKINSKDVDVDYGVMIDIPEDACS